MGVFVAISFDTAAGVFGAGEEKAKADELSQNKEKCKVDIINDLMSKNQHNEESIHKTAVNIKISGEDKCSIFENFTQYVFTAYNKTIQEIPKEEQNLELIKTIKKTYSWLAESSDEKTKEKLLSMSTKFLNEYDQKNKLYKCGPGERFEASDTSCQPCPDGTSQLEEQHRNQCIPDTSNEGDYIENKNCGPGEFFVESHQEGSCKPCPDGSYQNQKSHQQTACKPHTVCSFPNFLSEQSKIQAGRCLPKTQCGKGQYFVDNKTTGECNECQEGSFQGSENHRYTECAKQIKCSQNQYISTPGTKSSQTICSSTEPCNSYQFESRPPTSTSARECTQLTSCRSGKTYEVKAPTPNSDRVCGDVKPCSELTRGTHWQTQYASYTNNAQCQEFKKCSSNEYGVKPKTYGEVNGVKIFVNDLRCERLTECNNAKGEYETKAPTRFSDRECSKASTCAGGRTLDECTPFKSDWLHDKPTRCAEWINHVATNHYVGEIASEDAKRQQGYIYFHEKAIIRGEILIEDTSCGILVAYQKWRYNSTSHSCESKCENPRGISYDKNAGDYKWDNKPIYDDFTCFIEKNGTKPASALNSKQSVTPTLKVHEKLNST